MRPAQDTTSKYGIPAPFSIFLTQAYGFFDEDPANQPDHGPILQRFRTAGQAS